MYNMWCKIQNALLIYWMFVDYIWILIGIHVCYFNSNFDQYISEYVWNYWVFWNLQHAVGVHINGISNLILEVILLWGFKGITKALWLYLTFFDLQINFITCNLYQQPLQVSATAGVLESHMTCKSITRHDIHI